MKLRKVFAGMAASAIAMSMFAISASAGTAYVGGIFGYKDSTEIDGTTGEPFANSDNGAQFFYGEDTNPVDTEFVTAEVDFTKAGSYSVTTKAPSEGGFNKTNSLTVLGLYVKLNDDDFAAGIENGQKNIAGAVSEDEGDVEEQTPVDVTIDSILFDGQEVSADWNANYGLYVMGDEFKVEFVNIWNTDISDNDLMDEAKKTTGKLGAPVSEVTINFTVTPKNAGGDDSSSQAEDDSSKAGEDDSSKAGENDSSSKADDKSSSSTAGTTTTKTTTTTTTTGGTATTTSTASDNTNAGTGATAGIALAGLALAGAAAVISKRK